MPRHRCPDAPCAAACSMRAAACPHSGAACCSSMIWRTFDAPSAKCATVRTCSGGVHAAAAAAKSAAAPPTPCVVRMRARVQKHAYGSNTRARKAGAAARTYKVVVLGGHQRAAAWAQRRRNRCEQARLRGGAIDCVGRQHHVVRRRRQQRRQRAPVAGKEAQPRRWRGWASCRRVPCSRQVCGNAGRGERVQHFRVEVLERDVSCAGQRSHHARHAVAAAQLQHRRACERRRRLRRARC